MKVLLISGEYPPMIGGVSRYTYNLASALRKRHVEVEIVASASCSNVSVHRWIKKGDRSNSDRILDTIEQFRPDVVHVQYERGLYEIDHTVGKILSRLIHGSTLNKFYRMSPVPTVTTLHTLFPYPEYQDYVKYRAYRKEGRFGFLPRPIRGYIRKVVLNNRYRLLKDVTKVSDEVVHLSEVTLGIIKRGVVIYHGAEPATVHFDKEEFRRELALPRDKLLLLAFGYAGSYKGFDILDDLVLPQNWTLVIKQTKHERGIEKPHDVKNALSLTTDYLDDIMLSRLFFACDAIIFPYRIVSASGVLFDALAHGLPFVASDLEFFREFADMKLGVVSERDPESFSKAIKEMADEHEQLKKNIEEFKRKLAWGQIADEHIQLYTRCLSKAGREYE